MKFARIVWIEYAFILKYIARIMGKDAERNPMVP